MPETNGNLSHTSSPSAAAAALASSMRPGGICAESSGRRISPLVSSSIREIRARRMRKLDGTMPEASPECTPSVSTCTVSAPPAMPRSEVVSHSWS